MEINIKNDWLDIVKDEFSKPYFEKLCNFVDEQDENFEIYPPKEERFRALELTSYANTRVVILGQDPYHNTGQAHGLVFSVNKDVKVPPSLRNIYKELKTDIGCYIPDNGNLIKWTKQGVLLLNTILTVKAHTPLSHKKKGWETFTDEIIKNLNAKKEPIVFVLWGNNAREKKNLITNEYHLVLEAMHPSPLSATRGFMGCKHFSKINDFLRQNHFSEIDWQIENMAD